VNYGDYAGKARTFTAQMNVQCNEWSPKLRVAIPTRMAGKHVAYRVYFDAGRETRWGDGYAGSSLLELPAGAASPGHPYVTPVYGVLASRPGAATQLGTLKGRIVLVRAWL
jgi:hypothetical protein